MRVALLTNFVPPYRLSLYEALAARVRELRLFVSTRMESNRAWMTEWGALGVTVQRTLTLHRMWRTSDFEEPYELHVPFDTTAQLRRWRPDVVVTAELGVRSLQALRYCRTARIPCVLWATLSDHTEQGRAWPRRAVRRFMLPRFDAIIVNGAAGERYIRQFGKVTANLIRVPYTTDMTPFLALPLARQSRRFLYVGSLTRRKGVDILAAASDGVPLTVVGDGPLRVELQKRAPSIEWAGNVAYTKLPEWFNAAGIFIFPTLADEWGVVVNEALAAGLPVLGSTYSQAVEETIVDGVNGWRFTPTDAKSCRDAIARVLATPDEEIARMRVAARASALELSPDEAARRIADLLHQL